ncbi:DUF4290 domain-containing protein [Cryomorphaceae bacterium 1068]|nr:DUF4290 domain-containing protein [Cryomorphaceae bacterium 1068]
MKLTYNSTRPDLKISEYGRSIHTMVAHCVTIEDRDERNRCARSIIKTMGNLFPQLRDVEDFNHKLWDHLHVMSDFKLDVESPYPKPTPESFESKPKKVGYPKNDIRLGHYGKTIEKLLEQVLLIEDDEERQKATISMGNVMKRAYVVWNQNSVRDEVIASDLQKLSNGKLKLENPEQDLESTQKVIQQMGVNKPPQRQNQRKGQKKRRKKRN